MIAPPPKPCIALAPISQVIDCAAPHNADHPRDIRYHVSFIQACAPSLLRLTRPDEKHADPGNHQSFSADDIAVERKIGLFIACNLESDPKLLTKLWGKMGLAYDRDKVRLCLLDLTSSPTRYHDSRNQKIRCSDPRIFSSYLRNIVSHFGPMVDASRTVKTHEMR